MAMALLDDPGVVPNVFGERIAEGWRAAMAGSPGWPLGWGAARQSGRARFGRGVPATNMLMGRRGPLRF